MDIIEITENEIDEAAPLTASFRRVLKSYKGIAATADTAAAVEELQEYRQARFPMFLARIDGQAAGYIVCRIEGTIVWVESIYVANAFRRQGVASALFKEAEKIAAGYGETTVFNYVHPNNDGMIAFLRKHGYTVLNLIEIRKPFPDEKLHRQIRIEDNQFDY